MNEKFKILSLDGGGVRGYLSIKILENTEKHLNDKDGQDIPIGLRFDLIVGTSTGAIIAGLLALGKSAKDIRKLYENDIPIIFGKNMKRNKVAGFIWSKYKPDSLIKKANEYFGDNTFKDVKTDLIVTSVDISTMSPKFYKSCFSSKNEDRSDEKLASAIVASASAPKYFPVARELAHSDYLIDGGIVANNPSMVALIDSLTFDKSSKREKRKKLNTFEDVLLLSIGTGAQTQRPYDMKPLLNSGGMDWLLQLPLGKYQKSTPLIEILMASQSKMVEFQVESLLRSANGKYLRINPELASKMELDDVNCFGELKNISNLLDRDIEWLETNMIGVTK